MANGLILNVDTTKSEFQNPMVELRQGDGNYQSLHVTVTNNGDPVDLTGWTITFMGTTAGAHKIVDANAVVDNALQGTFNYTPTKAWGQDIGEFNKAYFKFVKSDETASGANFRVNVLEAVDLTDEEASNYISVVDALIDKVKTDMDAKLADTQTTLTNTQNQANTVQTNVDDLNTNVNDLKSQNNNIRTADNEWTGNNVFSNIINGQLAVKEAQFTDFADVAKNMGIYSGNWFINSKQVNNSPFGNDVQYAVVTVVQNSLSSSGAIIYHSYPSWKQGDFIGIVDSTKLLKWNKYVYDDQVVHNTGNETISGNKTFTGANTFSGINNFNAAQNFNGGVIGTGYSSLLNSGNGLSVIASGAQQTTDAGQSWHKLANDDSVVHLTGTENITGSKTFSDLIANKLTVNSIDYSYSSATSLTWTNYQSGNIYVEKINGVVYISSDNLNLTKPAQFQLPTGFLPRHALDFGVGGLNSSGTTAGGYGHITASGLFVVDSMGFASGAARAFLDVNFIAQ